MGISIRFIKSAGAALVAALLLFLPDAAQAQNLSINDASQFEGNAGLTMVTFTVTLDAPAGVGGVTFDIATADGTATLADNDYVDQSLTAQTIPQGFTTYQFDVFLNGDVTIEPGETFFVNVTNVTGATVVDGQGQGTIVDDDGPLTPIHDIQGPGASSPIVSAVVTTRGIVTGVRSDGFFIQEPDAQVDADPATSEGIFVFTSSAPPAAVVFSALVQVTGTVSEVVPSGDPQQPPVTQITSPSSIGQFLSPGQPLPTVVPLTSTFPDPAGPHDQLERVEGMRVSVASLTVTGATGGAVDQVNATATTDGLFYGVVTGVARPFREAGIQAPDSPPSGSIPPIPRWDGNPEVIAVASAGLGLSALDVKSSDVVTLIAGPLDYAARAYTILPDGTQPTSVTPGTLPAVVTAATAHEVTVASINLRRLFDTTDDAGADVVLTAPAYGTRLAKTSTAIRTHLLNPDIIGVQEAENIGVLNALAAQIVTDGGPAYTAYLEEGNDPEGLDVGFLVKTELVTGGVPRVSVTSVTQTLSSSTWLDPVDGLPATLHERPPLVLTATVNRTSTVGFPIVVVNSDHLGMTGINDQTIDGLTTVGDRVRQKRLAQAQSLANYVQLRQTNDAAERLVVLGSFNAFEMNDGYADPIGTIIGTLPPDNETVVPGDGIDLVNPDLVNLFATPPIAERYSDVFRGTARNVDHVLVSAGLVAGTTARRIERPRIAADQPEVEMNSGASALRFSDRDPMVAYFAPDQFSVAEVDVTNVDTPDPVVAGQNITYTITATNSGPDPADTAALADTLPAGTTFVSLSSPGGWSCTTPAVGAGGTVNCTNAAMAVGTAAFTLTLQVSPAVASGTVISNTATFTSTAGDSTPGDNSATAQTTVDGAPTITDITNQTIDEDGTTGALPFTIGDVGTAAGSLAVSAGSSDQALVPNANIILGGSGANRTITVTPVANGNGGPALITVTVTDGTAMTATDTFAVMVTPINDAPTIGTITNQNANANATVGPLPVTVGDIDNDVATLTLSATSSNQTLLTNAGITFGGSGANRTVTIAPVANQGGQTTITVTVNDGAATASTSFVLTVEPPPAPTALTYLLAEGATGTFFDEDLTIANPNTAAADVTVTFFREGMTNITETRTIPGRSSVTLHVDTIPGLEATAAAVEVKSEDGLPLAVERTQFWGEGSYGGHTENAVPAAAPRWYFAEGSQGFFDTFVLVGNPQTDPVDVTLTFLRENDTPFTTTVQLAPLSRKTISAATIPELVNRSFGVIVDGTLPVVAERAMYFGSTPTRPWSGGGAAAGATNPSTDWYFAEGATGTFFDTFILMMNPDTTNDAHVTLRYLLDTGETIEVPKVIPANGRLTVNIEAEDDTRLRNAAMSARITSDRPIVAERSVYWPTGEGAQPWGESHVTQGVTAAGSRWALAEGRTGGALNFHTYVLLGNPSTQAANVTVEFIPQSGSPVLKTFNVPANSRFTVDATFEAPSITNGSFMTLISTAGGVPIVVERSLYWDGAGLTWSGGSSAVATRLPQ